MLMSSNNLHFYIAILYGWSLFSSAVVIPQHYHWYAAAVYLGG